MMKFRVTPHTTKPDTQMIEVWNGNTFVGGIYPTEFGLKIVSKNIVNDHRLIAIEVDDPPAVHVNLLPLRNPWKCAIAVSPSTTRTRQRKESCGVSLRGRVSTFT